MMAEFPSLPLWTDAYIADTQHLTNEEHGVYLRLLMFAWRTPTCSLPDDDRRLAIMVGVTPKVWDRLKPVVMAFWDLSEGEWTQKKLTRERDFVRAKREQCSAAGKASAEAKALKNNNTGSTGVITGGQREGQRNANAHTHTHKEKDKPNGLSKKKGSRLPDGWLPPDEIIQAIGNELGQSRDSLLRENRKFEDYWRGVPGQKGVKLDWVATWRNWMRRAFEGSAPSRSVRVDAFGIPLETS